MTDLKKIIKEGTENNNSLLMEVTNCLADTLEKNLSSEDYLYLCKRVYAKAKGEHYNKDFADMQIAKMYYEDEDGEHKAPYLTEEEVTSIYKKHEDEIPSPYNYEDFKVVLNMIISDNHKLFEKWFEGEDLKSKYVEATINWLDDPDNPYGDCKVWRYFNS